MNPVNYLEQIEKELSSSGFDCSLEPSGADRFGRLLLFLGHDYKQRERVMEITAQPQDLSAVLPASSPQETPCIRIQFQARLPFHLIDTCVNETSSLLFFLNRMLELPGFELDETHSSVFYRYVLLTTREEIHSSLIKGIAGAAILLQDLFSESIERVATGKTTFNELLENILKMTESLA
jgi:hypothetical protein